MTVHSSGQTIFSFSYIERIILDASEEIDQIAGGANGMDVDRRNEIGDMLVKDKLLGCMGQVLQWDF